MHNVSFTRNIRHSQNTQLSFDDSAPAHFSFTIFPFLNQHLSKHFCFFFFAVHVFFFLCGLHLSRCFIFIRICSSFSHGPPRDFLVLTITRATMVERMN